MTKSIVALQGKGDTGKTTTIGILHDKLLKKGFKRENYVEGGQRRKGRRREFHAIFMVNGKKVGIASVGDLRKHIEPRLREFGKEGCSIIVCACHTRGGTVEVIEEFARTGWDLEFVQKQHGIDENALNEADADHLLKKVLRLGKL
jgi:hypothetical protein